MSAIAFGIPVQFSKAYLEGISRLTAEDISYAEELGYRIKLLGITKRKPGGIELRVHPTLIPEQRLIANVNGVMNAVLARAMPLARPCITVPARCRTDRIGGGGRSGRCDASADRRSASSRAASGIPAKPDVRPADPADRGNRNLLLPASGCAGQKGVLADVTRILADADISIDAMMMKEPQQGEERVDVIILTHLAVEKNVNRHRQDRGAADHQRQQSHPHPPGNPGQVRIGHTVHQHRGGMAPQSFSDILLGGLGRMAVWWSFPTGCRSWIGPHWKWRGLSYQDLAFEVISLFATDIPADDLRDIINKTYTKDALAATKSRR